MEVGPAVRSGDHTVVRLRFTSKENYTSPHLDGAYTLLNVHLLSLKRGLAWPELNTAMVLAGPSIEQDKPLDVFPIYTALDPDITSVEVLVPAFGVALGVPVVEESDAGFSVAKAIADAELSTSDKGPLPLEHFAAAADGSLDVTTTQKSVTVALASDVTFATDSAGLSAQADGILRTAAAEVGKYPSGGNLAIVGHTDDVADDAYNQDLSERRAQSVATRLGQLTDLAAWQVTVEGKGETQPRVEGTTDEARASNRRVEVVVTAKNPAEADGSSAKPAPAGEMPPAVGAAGKGPSGVEFDWPNLGRVRLEIDKATRVGNFLIGDVLATALDKEGTVSTSMNLPRPFNERWAGRGGVDAAGSDSLTLLVGGMRHLVADYKRSDTWRPLTSQNLPTMKPGTPLHMVAVWPDPGQDSVVVDLPGTGNTSGSPGPIVRLTDIPVVDA